MSERDERGIDDDAADERLVHGLLATLHEDDAARERRIARLMHAVEAEEPARTRGLRWRRVLPAAAALLLGLVALAILSGGESARAQVRACVDRMHAGLDRRYALSVALERADGAPLALEGVVDVDGTGSVVMRLDTAGLVPFDHVVVGRDDEGEWVMHAGGPAVRPGEERGWPRWMRLEGSPVLFESIDTLVEELPRYALEHGPEGDADTVHVIAIRREPDPGRPERVDLWIERASHIVTRLELGWPGLDDDPALRAELEEAWDELAPDHRARAEDVHAPARIAYRLLERPAFPEGWFSPGAHGG